LNFPFEMRDQKQITNVPGVSFLPFSHEAHMLTTDKDGNLTEEHNLPPSRRAYDQVRLLCDRLPQNATIGLILAVSKINPEEVKTIQPQNGLVLTYEKSIYEHWIRARPPVILVSGEYSVLNRPHKVNQTYQVLAQ
jgi:hypothetical protein